MNAYELANYVDAREINNPHLKQAATMLRQQADQIAELEKQLDKTVFCDFCDPTGEKQKADQIKELEDKLHWLVQHPIKKLSDEEIDTIYHKTLNRFDFARAIIKEITE